MESICIKVNITKLAGIKTQLPEFLFQATNYDTSCTSTNLQILQKKKKKPVERNDPSHPERKWHLRKMTVIIL